MAVTARAVKMSRGAVPVSLSCPASEPRGCEGTIALETLGPVRVTRARKRKVKFGGSSFRVAGGARANVDVHLARRNQLLLRKLGKVRALAIVRARDSAGNAKTIRAILIVKAGRARTR
jgi:hypothetical protein